VSKRAQMIGATRGRLALSGSCPTRSDRVFSDIFAVTIPDVFAFGVWNALLGSVNSIPAESSAIVRRSSGANMEPATSG
jgi:hypothetical protein